MARTVKSMATVLGLLVLVEDGRLWQCSSLGSHGSKIVLCTLCTHASHARPSTASIEDSYGGRTLSRKRLERIRLEHAGPQYVGHPPPEPPRKL